MTDLSTILADGRNPRLTDLRNWLLALSSRVTAAPLGAIGFATVADIDARDAFFADADNRDKLVYVNNNNGSASDSANGLYEFADGAPRVASGFVQGLAGLVQPIADEAAAARDATIAIVSSFADLDTIGRPATPVTGAFSATLTTRIFNAPAQFSGLITKVRLFSLLTGADTAVVKLKVFDRNAGPGSLKNGDSLAQNGADTELTITGGGLQEFDVSVPIEAGQFVGWYHSDTHAVAYLATTSDSGGFWADDSEVGDNSAMTVDHLTTTAQWQIGFDVTAQIVTKETGRKADFAFDVATAQLGRKQRPIPAIDANISWVMCLSADFINPEQEVGTDNVLHDWLDRSGNGNSPDSNLAVSSADAPVFDPDALGDGVPGVQFAGGSDGAGPLNVMYLARTMKLTQPFTAVAIVMLPETNTGELRLFDGYVDAALNERCMVGLLAGGKPYIKSGNAAGAIASSDAISAGAPHLLVATFNGASSSVAVDGVVKATGDTKSDGLGGLLLGCGVAAIAHWNGPIAMVGFVDSVLSSDQLAAIEAYAADRFGITIA